MTAIVQNLRTPIVLPVAAAITVGLFLMMRQMIDVGPVEPVVATERPAYAINVEVDPIDPDPRIDITAIPPVEPPPPVQRLLVDRSAPANPGDGVTYGLPPVDPPELSNNDGLVQVNRNPVPIVRIQPVFPAREAARGNSGSCTVMFDITPQGTTTNIRPVACDSRAFEQATLNAVSRWRYNPQVQDGEPILFRGATTRLDYQLNG